MSERYDGDDRESRTAFRAYDSLSEPVSGRTPWQIWRDACAWQAARAPTPSAPSPDDSIANAFERDYEKVIRSRDVAIKDYGITEIKGLSGENTVDTLIHLLLEARASTPAPVAMTEGCTPADAQMLRKANHGLALEIDKYRAALSELCREIHAFAEVDGEADFYVGDAEALLNAAPPTRPDVGDAREQVLEDESEGAWVAFETSHHAQMSNKMDLWPVWIDAWFAAGLASPPTRSDGDDVRFIAKHGSRLAQLLGIWNYYDLADRDAQIADIIASTPTQQGKEPV